MVEKTFKCIICGKTTISPRAHIPIHRLDEIIDSFVKLTIKNEIKPESKEIPLTEYKFKT